MQKSAKKIGRLVPLPSNSIGFSCFNKTKFPLQKCEPIAAGSFLGSSVEQLLLQQKLNILIHLKPKGVFYTKFFKILL